MDQPVQKPGDIIEGTDAASVAQGVVEDHAAYKMLSRRVKTSCHANATRFSGLVRD